MKILMFFHGGSGNRGCEAIVRSAIKIIRKKHENAYLALASTKPGTDKIIDGLDEIVFHNQNRGFKRFSLPYFQNLFETRIKNTYNASYRLMHEDIISRIDDFDVFLSIGGDNYCYGDLPDYYELDRKIKAKGKKLILWGASLGKEDVSTQNKLADLSMFDALLIRETESLEELRELGLKNAHLVADGAFVLDKEMLDLPDEWDEGNTIGFNYSPLVFNKHPQSRDAAIKLLSHILETTAYKIALTPHVIQPGNDDYACMKDLLQDMKNVNGIEKVFLLPDNLNAIQYKGYIARMNLFIGARTHATIAAYSSKVPTMVLGYSIKSLGIAKDLFGYERLVLKSSEISDADLLIEKFKELVRDQEEIKQVLEKRIPEIQKMSYRAGEYI
ncbi:MAG: polysaccharide pyruvyl transferase family protein [Flavobacteriaceae bacterium]|jgi:polysaccharide pyruvyl transferase WcaK-like protein|nr:polysaccharide pyruvyl transferase family protein [Flavobacteriaceae bacterium]